MIAVYPDLRDRSVLVTGGSRGIGAATARAFAEQGARVCVLGRDAEALESVVSEITLAGGTAMCALADVSDAAALARVHQEVVHEFGPVDVLAAFAGGQGLAVPTQDLAEERWHEVLDCNLTSAFLTVRTVLPGMLERGSGAIVTMSSTAGRQPEQVNLAYAVANAGLVMLTRHLATEIGPRGVRVNCIAPTTVLTEKVRKHMPPDIRNRVAASHPLRRLATPEDVARTALFLASDASSYLTGLTLDVTGGRVTG
ncbi:SDR family NAD(P)-dependent oxidoreductase [Streptomyces sp. HPF1205]|uniref:SDR family NAD(P)-dependent oxidoreductase n=1 Tax=Streptomyces sp. HPF1205 TaxID=2873262 RepID=UPI001CEC2398|nr:SDR family NAD(P)-dependent oxidoreductase [Streptomyces sp. HPF1205]